MFGILIPRTTKYNVLSEASPRCSQNQQFILNSRRENLNSPIFVLRDKTKDAKFTYNPNDDKQNYPFIWLVEKFGHY